MMKLKKEHLTQRVEIKEGFLEEVVPKLSRVLRINVSQVKKGWMEGGYEHSSTGSNRGMEALGSYGGKARRLERLEIESKEDRKGTWKGMRLNR